MIIKTNEIDGAALDWAVAKCNGIEWEQGDLDAGEYGPGFKPSTDWAQGGPIIERERITVVAMPDGSWQSQGKDLRPHFHNPTPLVAAMRCYVASKLGDEVDVPEELLGEDICLRE